MLTLPSYPRELAITDAFILAMLLGKPYCERALEEAEQAQRFEDCARWHEALRLPVPFVLPVIAPHVGDGNLLDDVDDLAQLAVVLRDLVRLSGDADKSFFPVNHPVQASRYYSFERCEPVPDAGGVATICYTGSCRD